jgi:probable HAF family extracellular repeat protein
MNKFKRLLLSSTVVALVGAMSGQVRAQGQAEAEAAPVRYRLTVLNPLPDIINSSAVGINAKGQVAVVSFGQIPEQQIASYIWQNNRVKRVPLESVFDINFRGWITGYHLGRAAIFKGRGEVMPIDTGTAEAAGVSINNRGNVLVTTFSPDGSFLFKGGALIDLRRKGVLRGNTVNDLDQVAGLCRGNVACIYDNGKVRRLAPQKLPNGDAVHISREGRVIGTYQFRAFERHGFLYHNGTVTDLGRMEPQDINSAGTIVGSNDGSAAIRVGGKVYDLNTLTNGLGELRLELANSVNGRGEIVGQGFDRAIGATRGFLLQPITAAADTIAN